LNVGLFEKCFSSGKYQEAISSILALPGARAGHVTPKSVLTISEKFLYRGFPGEVELLNLSVSEIQAGEQDHVQFGTFCATKRQKVTTMSRLNFKILRCRFLLGRKLVPSKSVLTILGYSSGLRVRDLQP